MEASYLLQCIIMEKQSIGLYMESFLQYVDESNRMKKLNEKYQFNQE